MGAFCALALASGLRPGVTQEPPWLALLAGNVLLVFGAISLPWLGLHRKVIGSLFLLLCFIMLYFLAPLLGGTLDAYRTFVAQLGWGGFCGVFLCLSMGLRSGRRWRLLAWSFLLLTAALSLYGLSRFQSAQQERLLSTFVNADCFSLFPLTSIFLGLGLFHRAGPQARFFLHANTVFQLLAVLLTGARATVVGLVVASFAQGFLLSKRKKRKDARPVLETLAPLAMAIFLLLLSSFFLLPGSQRWQRLLEGNEIQGVAMRRDVLIHGSRAVLASPLWGSGPGTFALRYQQYRPNSEVPERIYVNVAHNDYVEMAVESGLLVLGLWCCLVLTIFEQVSKSMKRDPLAYEYSGAAAALLGILVYQSLNFAFPVPADLFLMAFLMGLCVSATEPGPAGPTLVGASRRVMLVSAVVFCGLGLWGSHRAFQAQMGYVSARTGLNHLNRLELEAAEQAYQDALRHLPSRAAWWLKLAEVQTLIAEMDPVTKANDRSLHSLEKAYMSSPRELQVAMAWARGLAEVRKLEDALKVLQSAVSTANYYFPLRREQVNLYLRDGKILEAAETQLLIYERDPETLKRASALLAAAEIAVPEAAEKLLAKVPIALPPLEPLIVETSRRLVVSKHYQEADRIQKVWGQLKGEDSCFWLERSSIWATAKRIDMELRCLERAVEDRNLSSNCFEKALLRYVEVASLGGKSKTAEARLLAYVERGTAGSPAIAGLARMHLKKAHLESCRKVIVAGLEQYPRDPHLLVVRAELSLAEGFEDSAREDLLDVLQVDEENKEARALLRKLRKVPDPSSRQGL